MSKRPWYIWLSFIAFGIISYQCSTTILHGDGKRDYNLWFRYIGIVILWGIITLIVPVGAILLLMHIAFKYNHVLGTAINIIGLMYVYFGGVIFSTKLYDWKLKNIESK